VSRDTRERVRTFLQERGASRLGKVGEQEDGYLLLQEKLTPNRSACKNGNSNGKIGRVGILMERWMSRTLRADRFLST
jgi:hypothetical protein